MFRKKKEKKKKRPFKFKCAMFIQLKVDFLAITCVPMLIECLQKFRSPFFLAVSGVVVSSSLDEG